MKRNSNKFDFPLSKSKTILPIFVPSVHACFISLYRNGPISAERKLVYVHLCSSGALLSFAETLYIWYCWKGLHLSCPGKKTKLLYLQFLLSSKVENTLFTVCALLKIIKLILRINQKQLETLQKC